MPIFHLALHPLNWYTYFKFLWWHVSSLCMWQIVHAADCACDNLSMLQSVHSPVRTCGSLYMRQSVHVAAPQLLLSYRSWQSFANYLSTICVSCVSCACCVACACCVPRACCVFRVCCCPCACCTCLLPTCHLHGRSQVANMTSVSQHRQLVPAPDTSIEQPRQNR